MQEIVKLDKKGLRDFGLIFGLMIALVFGIIGPLLWRHALPVWPWMGAGIFWVWALLAPQTLNPVYQVWMRIGLVLGWINTRLILGIIFYLILTPMGIIRRMMGSDPMRREWKRHVESYSIPYQVRTIQSMERPF